MISHLVADRLRRSGITVAASREALYPQRQVKTATEVARIRDESQAKINALNERIRDLNEKLSGNGKGFFKR